MNNIEVATVLRKAANNITSENWGRGTDIDFCGWWNNDHVNPRGCVGWHIGQVMNADFTAITDFEHVLLLFGKLISAPVVSRIDGTREPWIPIWNDDVAEDWTDVVAALHSVADELDPQPIPVLEDDRIMVAGD